MDEVRPGVGSPGDAFVEALARRTAELVVEQQPKPEQTERQMLFSIKEAANLWPVTEDAIRAALKTGRLPRHKRGTRIVLAREDLDAWCRGLS